MGPDALVEYEALHEDVPLWLRQSLEDWIRACLSSETGRWDKDKLQCLERALRLPLDWSEAAGPHLMTRLRSDTDLALEVVDYLLRDLESTRYAAANLRSMLEEAGSAWMVAAKSKGCCLERRVSQAVEASARAATVLPGSGEHLSKAWSAAYGRQPNPSFAYSEAVKAVEVAARPVVTPTDAMATLGKMINALRDAPRKWDVILAGPPNFDRVEVVRSMAALLCKGQTDRHGNAEPVPVTQEQAEAAVHLAILLVQWFATGAIRRVS